MEIQTYNDASQIPEEQLSSLVDAEIECWWSRPFDEYRICNNEECRAIFSIEDVFWSLENFFKKKEEKSVFWCEECGDWTSFVYEKEKFLMKVREYIKEDVVTILLLEKEETVRWFWVVSIKPVKSIIDLEFNTRPWSYNKYLLLKMIWKYFSSQKNCADKKIICFHHIFVWIDLRGQWYWNKISEKQIDILKKNEWTPIILETIKNSQGYYFAINMGFKALMEDKYWYVIMFLEEDNASYEEVISNIIKNKASNKWNNQTTNKINNRKFYK